MSRQHSLLRSLAVVTSVAQVSAIEDDSSTATHGNDAKDEGPARARGDTFYAGYFRDLDGNKLRAFYAPA